MRSGERASEPQPQVPQTRETMTTSAGCTRASCPAERPPRLQRKRRRRRCPPASFMDAAPPATAERASGGECGNEREGGGRVSEQVRDCEIAAGRRARAGRPARVAWPRPLALVAAALPPRLSLLPLLLLLICCAGQLSSQQLLMFSSRNERHHHHHAPPSSSHRRASQNSLQVVSSQQTASGGGVASAQRQPHQQHASGSSSALAPWRSQQSPASLQFASGAATAAAAAHHDHSEARGALTRNLYSRGARNASLSGGGGGGGGGTAGGGGASSGLSGGGGGGGSWHFPRISPEQAAEVLLTGAQVINRIAQADTPLNYCRTPDNQEGECSDIRKCIWLVLDKARLKQSVCLRNLIIPAVCCPVSSANNTPMANMIQSTLEPVLFRPGKGPSAGKQKPAPAPSTAGNPPKQPTGAHQQQEPAPSAAEGHSSSALVIKGASSGSSSGSVPLSSQSSSTTTTSVPSSSSSTSTSGGGGGGSTSTSPTSTTTSTSTTTTTTSTTTGAAGQGASPGAPANQLFQDLHDDESAGVQHGTKTNAVYNRTISQKYPWANETCGEGGRARTGRIVGGSDSKLGQWPWMTAMYLNKRSFGGGGSGAAASGSGEFWCGGALINRRFILTAAHCLSDQRGNRYKNDQVTIKLGGVDLVRHQAPSDILRNAELSSAQESAAGRSSSQPAQFFATHLTSDSPVKPARRSGAANSRSSHRSGGGDDDEEFSWTAFITKALGLGGGGGSTSSSSLGASHSSGTSVWSSSSAAAAAGHMSNKALEPGGADKKLRQQQQLAAHARKTYFKEYRVASIKQHPKFQRHGFYNDIGLIELKSDVDFDELVAPICLPTEHDLKRDLTGYMATVLGWGTLSYGGQGSKLLQQVAMPVWSNKDCDDRYLQHIGKTFLCAGFLTGGKDACQGDSGGPLMVGDQTGRWTLHGVVSFGKTCAQAGYPGVYTRVTEYLDWIRDNTDLVGYRTAASTAPAAPGQHTTSRAAERVA